MEGNEPMGRRKLKKAAALCSLIFLLGFMPSCQRDEEPDSAEDRQNRLEQLMQTYDQQFVGYLNQAQQEMGKEILKYSPISSSAPVLKRMDVLGSHYEYGNLVGRIARLYGRIPGRVAEGRRDLNERIIGMYRQICPQYLDFARGLGEAFAIPMEELDFAGLEYDFIVGFWYSLFRYDEFQSLAGESATDSAATSTHCSLVFAKVGEDAFVGRNFDDEHEKPQFVEFTQLDDGYRVMANNCYVPYHWIMDGVNEKGLLMGTANLVNPEKYYWTDPYPDVPAVCEHHLFRVALETCATVDEVIALYRSVRPWSHATDHLLVADAQGNSAVIEFNLDRQAVFFPAEKNYQIMTNIAYQEGLDYMMNNCRRFAQATAMAEEGIQSFADVARITRSICASSHGYTSLYDLRKRFMQLYRRLEYSKSYDFTLPQ
jgi:predicted choloylglycine hydrolase